MLYIEVPLLMILLVTGFFLSLVFEFLPQRHIIRSVKSLIMPDKSKTGISSYKSLCTLLAATIGTGNIVGVAAAIEIGGAGVLGWMWLSAFLGMSTQFVECAIGAKYREGNCGGTMYALKKGVGGRFGLILGTIFAVVTAAAAFGIGNLVQANAAGVAVTESFGMRPVSCGVIMTVLIGITLLRGIKSISRVTAYLVPLMGLVYLVSCIIVVCANFNKLGIVMAEIIFGMFNPKATACGSAVGIIQVMYQGLSKGVFSNEAGLGSSSIAASATVCASPVENGYTGSLGAFFDTIIICTVTGFAILTSGKITAAEAFQSVLGNIGGYIVNLGIIFFAYSSIPGWEYIGETAFTFLAKKKIYCYIYRSGYIVMVFAGVMLNTEFVWRVAAFMNVLMILPNIISMALLWRRLKPDVAKYEREH